MGNRYHIPDNTRLHVFTQAALGCQNVVAERFGVSTRTVRCFFLQNLYTGGRIIHYNRSEGQGTYAMGWEDDGQRRDDEP